MNQDQDPQPLPKDNQARSGAGTLRERAKDRLRRLREAKAAQQKKG